MYVLNRKKGFTLIELAIVLVIVGLLLGLGMGMLGPLTKRVKVNETKNIIDAAVESVISYGASNNKLPDTSTFPTIVRKPTDIWGYTLYYIIDNNLTDTDLGGICGRKTTSLGIDICHDSSCTSSTTINNVAFMVLSGGLNFNNQTTGTQSVTSATTINVYDVGLDNIDNYPTDMNRPEPYDDIMKWITLNELRIKAGCVGSPLKILNNELPVGYENNPGYNAAIYADGGVPFSGTDKYRWCRQGSAPTGLAFTPNTSPSNCLSLSESLWGLSDNLTILGIPGTPGSFNLTFFVRDDNDASGGNDNVAQKTLVLTINPSPE